MSKLPKPTLIDIYESEECQGIISPYILKESLLSVVDTMLEKHKDLYKIPESIPDATIVCGSPLDCATIDSQRSHIRNAQQPNNLTMSNSQSTNHCAMLGKEAKVLPPHKVVYDCTGSSPTFESNIYNPCIIPVKRCTTSNNSGNTYPTGDYPGDVETFPTVNQLKENQGQQYDYNCNCCNQSDYTDLSQYKDILQSELFLWLDHIRGIQITNLISSLIESNKIPIDPDLIFIMRRTLEELLNSRLYQQVRKFGVMTYTQRTISAPHIKRRLQLFVQVNTDDAGKKMFAESLTTSIFSKLSPTQHQQNFSVMVMTEKEYEYNRQHYPINLCFDCITGSMVSHNIPTMEMIMVNDNQFIPKISMKFNTDNIVEIMAPADCMHVSAGTSGKVAFRIGNNDLLHKWMVDTVTVNNHVYTLEELVCAHNPDHAGSQCIREYEYSSLSAEVTGGLDSVATPPYEPLIVTLFYTNVMSDIEVSIKPVQVLSKDEFDFDIKSAITRVYDMIPMDLSFFKGTSQYTQGKSAESGEPDDTEDNISDGGESVDSPGEQNHLSLGINLSIPFSGICKNIRNQDSISLRQIIRDLDSNEFMATIPCENALVGIAGMAGGCQNTKDGESSLIYAKHLTITDTYRSTNTEYQLTISQGALWASPKRNSTMCTGGYLSQRVNQDLKLRFALNTETKEIEILNDDELPSFLQKEDELPLSIEVAQLPGKVHFIEGSKVNKNTFTETGLCVFASGGAIGDHTMFVTDNIVVEEQILNKSCVCIDIYYMDEQKNIAHTSFPIHVYGETDVDAMYAHRVAYYTFDGEDRHFLRNDITRMNAQIVKSISTKPNLPKLTGTVFQLEGPFNKAAALCSNTGEGIKLDTTITTRDYTISLWVRPHTLNPDLTGSYFTPVLCALHPDNAYMILYALYRTPEGFTIRTVVDTQELELDPPYQNILTEQQWSMITMSVKNDEVSLYLNGEKLPVPEKNGKLLNFFEGYITTIYLGTCPFDNTFMGDYDEVSLFEAALTDEQVKILFDEFSDKLLPANGDDDNQETT